MNSLHHLLPVTGWLVRGLTGKKRGILTTRSLSRKRVYSSFRGTICPPPLSSAQSGALAPSIRECSQAEGFTNRSKLLCSSPKSYMSTREDRRRLRINCGWSWRGPEVFACINLTTLSSLSEYREGQNKATAHSTVEGEHPHYPEMSNSCAHSR